MPVGEIAAEALGGIFRVVGRVLFEIVFELLVRGAGYVICRIFSPAIDPDGWQVAVVGIIFWVLLGGVGYFVYTHGAEWLAVDRCLDSGGAFDRASQACVHAAP